MEEISIDINSFICLLQLLGFNISYEPDSLDVPKRGDKFHLASKNIKIDVDQIRASIEDQREPLVIPELTDENKQLIHEKLTSILGLMSGSKNNWVSSKHNSTEINAIRRGSSINVSKSFTIHHNVLVNLETSDICTSPPARCSSPVASRPGTPFMINPNSVTDILRKARNLIELAMEMSAKLGANSEQVGLNSTFTKDQTVEQSRINAPRISNISEISPLSDAASREVKHVDSVQQLVDIINTSNANHASKPTKLFNTLITTCINNVQKNDSMEKKRKRGFSKIGIFKHPSKVSGTTSSRNSPLEKMKENRIDTPRPIAPNKSISTSNLSSPYMRTTPRSTANNSLNTPSPRYLRATENKLTPTSGLRKPGWSAKK